MFDSIPTSKIQEVEKELLDNLKSRHADLMSSIAADKQISDENGEKLTAAIKEFVATKKY